MGVNLIALALVVPATLLVQQPDLAGRWILNEAESQIPGPRPDGARTYIPATELAISVDCMTITVESWMGGEPERGGASVRTFFADGQPHAGETAGGDSVVAVARWEDGRLAVESSRVVMFGMRRMIFRSNREYSVSEEGMKLTIDTQIRNPAGSSLQVTLVYERVD